MTRLVSPYGAVVDVSEEKAARLGWERLADEPAEKAEKPAKRAAAKKAAPTKRAASSK